MRFIHITIFGLALAQELPVFTQVGTSKLVELNENLEKRDVPKLKCAYPNYVPNGKFPLPIPEKYQPVVLPVKNIQNPSPKSVPKNNDAALPNVPLPKTVPIPNAPAPKNIPNVPAPKDAPSGPAPKDTTNLPPGPQGPVINPAAGINNLNAAVAALVRAATERAALFASGRLPIPNPVVVINPDKTVTIAGILIPKLVGDNAKAALDIALKLIPRPVSNNFAGDCISLHNVYRSLLGLKPLADSAKLRNAAQGYAQELARRDAFEHSKLGFGENLFQTTNGDMSCGAAIFAWMNEFSLYNGEPIGQGNFHGYGHFTQLISDRSTSVGCAAVQYPSGRNQKKVTVCEYEPAGNVAGVRVQVVFGGK
ncbi:CAP domain-containing protein [Globomyces pollinis-pini]|nr:CAP domain-containing protein [Globomyces pollinis-pini]